MGSSFLTPQRRWLIKCTALIVCLPLLGGSVTGQIVDLIARPSEHTCCCKLKEGVHHCRCWKCLQAALAEKRDEANDEEASISDDCSDDDAPPPLWAIPPGLLPAPSASTGLAIAPGRHLWQVLDLSSLDAPRPPYPPPLERLRFA